MSQGIICDAPDNDQRVGKTYIITVDGRSTHVDLCVAHVESATVAQAMSWGRAGPSPGRVARPRRRGVETLNDVPNFDDGNGGTGGGRR